MPNLPYVDDPTIENEDELWRRIFPGWVIVDSNSGEVRLSSAAFDDSRDGTPLSVLIAEMMIADHRGPENAIADFEGYCLASVTAGDVRESNQGVARTPTADEPAHGSVFGNKSKGIRKALAKQSRWVIPPIRQR